MKSPNERPENGEPPRLRWLRHAPGGLSSDNQRASLAPGTLGVLSGTFNPPTRAHLALGIAAVSQLGVSEVLFVLPIAPPHKSRLEAPLEHRAEMLVRAVGGDPRFSAAISTHGLFTDICRALEPEYPRDTRVIFLLGRDAAERILLRWPYADPDRAFEEMFARFECAVAERDGRFELPGSATAARHRDKIHSLALPEACGRLSATLARARAAAGEPLDDIVVPEVAAYISGCGLYRRGTKKS